MKRKNPVHLQKNEPMNIRPYIPNAFTTLNLISGLVSINFILEGQFVPASLAIFLAAIFDFLDGNAARLLKAYSELGKQLDSLADMVSFGVAPGLLIFRMISVYCEGGCNILEQYHITPYFALLIPVCSAFRLAKFNIDLRQSVNFIGLPTPANAMFFASIPLVVYHQPGLAALIPLDFMVDFLSNNRVLSILAVFFSYLLVSDMKLYSMKFRNMHWKGNELRYITLAGSVIMAGLFSLYALPLIIIFYLLLAAFFQGLISD